MVLGETDLKNQLYFDLKTVAYWNMRHRILDLSCKINVVVVIVSKKISIFNTKQMQLSQFQIVYFNNNELSHRFMTSRYLILIENR